MADGPDDPKQKADKAWRWCERQWDRAPSPSQMVEAAVTASIEAALVEALAPVLERVARLEDRVPLPFDDEDEALAGTSPKPPTPCATCGGARWVCDVSVDGASYHRSPCPDCSKPAAGPEGTLQHNPGLGSVTMSTEQAAALLKSSKPAEPEGEIACTRHGQYRCPACAAGMVEEAQPPSPAESKGKPDWAIAAALSPVLERVERLEELAQFPTLMAENDALLQKMAAASPEGEGMSAELRAVYEKKDPTEDDLIEMATSEAERAMLSLPPHCQPTAGGLRHNEDHANACAHRCWAFLCELRRKRSEAHSTLAQAEARLGEPRMVRRMGDFGEEVVQSVPQAPEQIRLQFRGGTPFIGGTLQPALNVSDAEYVRADLLEAATVLATTRYQAIQTLEADRQHLTNALRASTDKLASAERRIAELEGANAAMQVDLADFTNAAFANGRAEGREAGIREAAEVARAMRDADTGPSEYAQGARQGLQLAGRRILALLAKKPEVGT